jgi:hypothetical protein
MRSALTGVILLLNGIVMSTVADAVEWDGTVYAYPTVTAVRKDSLLNPDNQIARLPEQSQTVEARFDVKLHYQALRVTLRPILLWQQDRNDLGEAHDNEAYLSQGEVRWTLNDAWNLAAGREVMNWGPGQFRSASNPFYFDNGRTDPIRELGGIDVVKLSWTPNTRQSLSLGYITGSGHNETSTIDWQHTWILRATQRAEKGAAGLALAKKQGQAVFVGADMQYTLTDALLLYTEASSSTQPNILQSPVDPTQPFRVETESARHTTVLIGSSYTLTNGQSVSLEYLHHGHGYSVSELDAYFSRAANATLPADAGVLGMALSYAPPLLGRDYLHLVWQSNMFESDGYWRLMLTQSLTDQGKQVAGYAEMPFNQRVSGFGFAMHAWGSTRQEFPSLITSKVSIGVKVALP